jgi:hypothetical protein
VLTYQFRITGGSESDGFDVHMGIRAAHLKDAWDHALRVSNTLADIVGANLESVAVEEASEPRVCDCPDCQAGHTYHVNLKTASPRTGGEC